MDSYNGMEQRIPTILHDDGIFKYQKEWVHQRKTITQFAREIIESYRDNEFAKIAHLEKPLRSIPGVPDDVLLKQHQEQAGIIRHASSELYFAFTREEHQFPEDSFFLHCEPDYLHQKDAIEHHESYCWKVTLLNAFRVLDLEQCSEVEFPAFWDSIKITKEDPRYAGLLASASYQMGLYYAKALAIQKARHSAKGKEMTDPRKGKFGDLGKILYPLIAEIDKENPSLLGRGISQLLMDRLEERGLASTSEGLRKIFVGEKVEIVDTKKLGRYVDRYKEQKQKALKKGSH